MRWNKWEWSEFYVFLYLLYIKKIYFSDILLNKIENEFIDVLEVSRVENTTWEIGYNFKDWYIKSNRWKEYEVTDFAWLILDVFNKISDNLDTTFEIDSLENLMLELECNQISASSILKEDIWVLWVENITNTRFKNLFSIKSMLWSPSTLLNASKRTNFKFRVNWLSDNDIDEIKLLKAKNAIKHIYKAWWSLEFKWMKDSDIFFQNMQLVDSYMPNIIAEILISYYKWEATNLSELVEHINWNFDLSNDSIKLKLKKFLSAIALSMVPNSEWDWYDKAHWYIVLRRTWDLVCFHILKREIFEEYLYNNMKLDTPSTTRHKFGYIYTENWELYMELNLQIRSKK